jgi:hypothetical protein
MRRQLYGLAIFDPRQAFAPQAIAPSPPPRRRRRVQKERRSFRTGAVVEGRPWGSGRARLELERWSRRCDRGAKSGRRSAVSLQRPSAAPSMFRFETGRSRIAPIPVRSAHPSWPHAKVSAVPVLGTCVAEGVRAIFRSTRYFLYAPSKATDEAGLASLTHALSRGAESR